MIGAGPFSRASSSAASQPATAISRETSSVNFTDSGEPYFMPSSVIVLPSPRKPMPWRRLRRISSRCFSSGRPLISTTLSSMRVNTFTTSRYSSQSNSAKSRERMAHEARQIHRAEQARAIRRQRLLAARVGGADVLAPPVVVHLVDAIDEDEARLGEIVGGRHDDVPHTPRRQRLVDLAGDQAFFVDDVAFVHGPFAPHELLGIVEIRALRLELTAASAERRASSRDPRAPPA